MPRETKKSSSAWPLISATVMLLSACDLSPDFKLPEITMPEAFKEAPAPAEKEAPAEVVIDTVKWKRVDPKVKIEETAWWRMFNAPGLDALEEQAMKDNPSLDIAAQRVVAARGIAQVTSADLLPSVGIGAGPQRQKPSAAAINANFPSPTPIRTRPYTTYTLQGVINYELDLFGKNRNTLRGAQHDAEAEENNYRAARLTLQSDLAQAYFEHAALVMEEELLSKAAATRREFARLTEQKETIGAIDDLTLATAQTDLATVEAEEASLAQQRAVTEHRIAALIGVTPAELKLEAAKLEGPPPAVPAGLPSTLLERRPDIQAAAQGIAAANARIGAARAGYFPDISLSALGGFVSTDLGDLFKKSSEFWSLGPLAGGTILTQPLFEGGTLSGTLMERKADYEGASASYRGSVLNAFHEVEDNLSALRHLSEEATARKAAVTAGNRAYEVAGARYEAGYSSHLDYLDAERNFLATERSETQVLGARYIATVQLIKALGGSWPAPVK